MLRVADAAAEIAEHIANHSAHGYSQPNRAAVGTGGGRGETITLSDGRKVQISTGDRDCSSMAIECYAAQGIDCGGAWYTGDMISKMTASGNFKALPASTWRNPERGDLPGGFFKRGGEPCLEHSNARTSDGPAPPDGG